MITTKDVDFFPRITTVFESSTESPTNKLYVDVIRHTIRRILPHDFFSQGGDREERLRLFHRNLPLLTYSEVGKVPFNLSFFLLCKYRANAFKFFFEMVSRWLVPGKRLNVVLFSAIDFRLPDLSEDVYTIAEIMLSVDDEQDLETILRNRSLIETEIRLGIDSSYQAGRILEIKGLAADEKTALIQENITHLIKRRPTDFDHDIFSDMQHFLVMCSDEFKAVREYRHMSRIISVHYLFRKALTQSLEGMPDRRHLSLKLTRARLHLPGGTKMVLGVFVGVNFLRNNEVFEERHLIKAIQNYIPQACAVKDSFFVNQNRARNQSLRTLYLEVEKANGAPFSFGEIRRLRRELPNDLKGRIEHLMHPVFMPRNEEEILRNILTLSNQLKYTRDLPQVIISFEEQTDFALSFTVIVLRLVKSDSQPIQELFTESDTFLEYIPDGVKIVGNLRRKYPKEATVFRVNLPKGDFLRGDHSLDLYKARRVVVSELARLIGDIRDYNGGMISKQNELFCALKESLGLIAKDNELLLENYFHSLTPVVMRSVLEPIPLKTFFLLLLDALEDVSKRGNDFFKVQEDSDFVYAMITAENLSFITEVRRAVSQLSLPSIALSSVCVSIYDTVYFGYLYRCDEKDKRDLFCSTIRRAMKQTINTSN